MESRRTTLCIPRVSKDTSIREISKKLFDLEIGKIHKILELPIRNEEEYKRILIVIEFKGERGKELKELIQKGKSIKVIYKEPWYWKIVEYKKDYKIE